MQPGLYRFGTDFGNGAADSRFFLRDEHTPRFLSEKRRVLALAPQRFRIAAGAGHAPALDAAIRFMRETLVAEHGESFGKLRDFSELGLEIAEDFVVLRQTEDGDRAVLVHVCFPSGWRPERLVGQSFLEIHATIPEFDGIRSAAASLVQAMLLRGPYVRFVWTISADDELDHHPELGRRGHWSPPTPGFLRVERQITAPLPEAHASLFLIRTYLYRFDELTAEERATLAAALRQMPAAIVDYKGLRAALPAALRLLERDA
jgi:hypothetical protein